ncbi:MAG: TonB-dependent receptor, partial [Spirochaetota bacterium]|nr:TonB-dependent receptor [Spirochaetota bacterium]
GYFIDIPCEDKISNDIYNSRIGVKYFPFDHAFFIKGNIGKTHRAPLFSELFGERGFIIGNPYLKHETSINRDIGFGISQRKQILFFDWIDFEYAFFHNTTRDIIIFLQNSQLTMKAQNLDKARIMGHEFKLTMSIYDHLLLSCNYTLQEAIDKSGIPYYENNYLPHRPRNEASFRAKIFDKYLSLIYELSYTGVNFRDRANSEFYYLERRILHNLNLQLFPVSWIAVSLEVKNISDNRTKDIIGYPLPGRSYYATISSKF